MVRRECLAICLAAGVLGALGGRVRRATEGSSGRRSEGRDGAAPLMGWRSWNLYGEHVNQSMMERIMDGMVSKTRKVNGKPTSLCDIGYCDVGLDDNWQEFENSHKNFWLGNGWAYHDKDEDGSHYPRVNTRLFPDMSGMTNHAHQKGLKAGWYMNNCLNVGKLMQAKEILSWFLAPCLLHRAPRAVYEGDVKALVKYGFDSVKLDNCGFQRDDDLWAQLLNESGRQITIEGCKWGLVVPTETWCPWDYWRTGWDIRASYGSVLEALHFTDTVAKKGLSRPGCWAYPDMLQVGCSHGPGGDNDPGLSFAEARSHFGAWCIISSPLILSLDVNNDTVMDELWPIISNTEAIAVNQAWAGHSGSSFQRSPRTIRVTYCAEWPMFPGKCRIVHYKTPSWEYFYKPLGSNKVAVLLMNHDSSPQDLALHYKDIPGIECPDEALGAVQVRDVWEHKNIVEANHPLHGTDVLNVQVEPHDTAFLILEMKTPGGQACTVT